MKCFDCGHEIEIGDVLSRRDECSNCGADVRACKNCRFYDPKSYNECRETQADPIQEKERANFCDYFEPGDGKGGDKSRDALMSAAEALFKKK